jgi:hypothetical protein
VLLAGDAAFVYDAIDYITVAVPDVSPQCMGAVWDAFDPKMFLLTSADGEMRTYVYEARSTRGPRVVKVGTQAGSRDAAFTDAHRQELFARTLSMPRQPAADGAVARRHHVRWGVPLLCRNGALTWCDEDGQLRHSVLCSHTALQVSTVAACTLLQAAVPLTSGQPRTYAAGGFDATL